MTPQSTTEPPSIDLRASVILVLAFLSAVTIGGLRWAGGDPLEWAAAQGLIIFAAAFWGFSKLIREPQRGAHSPDE